MKPYHTLHFSLTNVARSNKSPVISLPIQYYINNVMIQQVQSTLMKNCLGTFMLTMFVIKQTLFVHFYNAI